MESRTMKDSGVEWIADIPEDWEVVALKHIATLNDDSLSMGTPGDYEFNYIDIGSVSFEEGIHSRELTTFEQAPSRARRLVRKNDIIISTVRTYLKAIAIIPDEENVVVSTGFAVIRPLDVLPLFLNYAVKSDYYTEKVSAYSYGVAYPSINASKLMSIKIAIPNEIEQQKIASFLDEKVSHIDSILEDTKKSIEDLKAYKQSLITETVTKGLNATVEMKDSGIKWIGEIPKHWQTVKMKRLGYVRNGLTYKPADIVDSSEGIMVLRSGNIQDSRLSFENNVYVNKEIKDELKVNAGDILICSRNGSRNLIGKNALIENDLEATFGAFMMLFKPIANSSYIYYILNSEVFNFYLGTFLTTTINQLTKSNFESMIVVFTPDEKEQLEIASYLKKNVENLNSIIDEKNKILMELKAYKKSLIYEYVTGKKEVQ